MCSVQGQRLSEAEYEAAKRFARSGPNVNVVMENASTSTIPASTTTGIRDTRFQVDTGKQLAESQGIRSPLKLNVNIDPPSQSAAVQTHAQYPTLTAPRRYEGRPFTAPERESRQLWSPDQRTQIDGFRPQSAATESIRQGQDEDGKQAKYPSSLLNYGRTGTSTEALKASHLSWTSNSEPVTTKNPYLRTTDQDATMLSRASYQHGTIGRIDYDEHKYQQFVPERRQMDLHENKTGAVSYSGNFGREYINDGGVRTESSPYLINYFSRAGTSAVHQGNTLADSSARMNRTLLSPR
jgi:hypothetical protein